MVEESRGFVAIIGMACRFPGAPSIDALWDLLVDGRESVGVYPRGRSDAMDAFLDQTGAADGPITERCGFLPQIETFDASFFSISPREAVFVDPQQRLLLELAWEAFEDAGKTQDDFRGSDTGVYAGVWSSDYLSLINNTQEASLLGQNGGALYSASGRVAFTYDLRGPEATVNLGCASGMAAVHLACEALSAGRCGMALAGAANVILDPGVTLAFTRGGVLSPGGRCEFGDASADGFVRSEGAGLFVLKPLSDAVRDGDRIRAVIRGSAVSNNGGSSQSLMTPSRVGQSNVLKQALKAARLSPAELQYVEAHGTGTAVGDPIEISALSDVIGKDPDRAEPCVIGSIKSNLGHTESASGIAGMIKVILAMQHRFVPPSLHVNQLNPAVDWQASGLRIETHGCAWPQTAGPARAGVSSFGLTGTNAHVILEEPPQSVAHLQANRSAWILPLSAGSEEGLRELAVSWKNHLVGELDLSDTCFTAATRRHTFARRLAVVGSDAKELSEGVEDWLNASASDRTHSEADEAKMHGPVFVFPGQGSQWIGMGQGLFRDEPVFRQSVEESSEALQTECGWSLLDHLGASSSDASSRSMAVVQPALFAIQAALAKLWMSWGVMPAMVVGHSMGEVAAAYTAGALSMQDAAAVIGRRSRLLERLSGQGAMAMVELSEEETEEAIHGYERKVAVAVTNGPQATVISGDPEAIHQILRSLESKQVFCRLLNVTVASHSPQVDPLLAELRSLLVGVKSRSAHIPIYSTTLGRLLTGEPMDAEYWSQNLRNPVRFHHAMEDLLKKDFGTFIEMSPHPSLLPYISETAALNGKQSVMTLGSLRRDEPEQATMLRALGRMFCNGSTVDWSGIYPAGQTVDLPSFAWQRERYWLETGTRKVTRPSAHRSDLMLRNAIVTAEGDHLWIFNINLDDLPWLRDHAVGTSVVLPACSFAELALEALADLTGERGGTVEKLTMGTALPLYSDKVTQVEVRVRRQPLGRYALTLHFKSENDAEWTLAARGLLDTRAVVIEEEAINVSTLLIEQPGDRRISSEQHRQEMLWRGYNFGPSFRCLDRYLLRGTEAVGKATLPDTIEIHNNATVPPVLLDAAFQLLAALFYAHQPHSGRLLPVQMDSLQRYAGVGAARTVYLRAHLPSPTRPAGSLHVYSEAGNLLLHMKNLVFAASATTDLTASHQLLYSIHWKAVACPQPSDHKNEYAWLILADESDLGARLAAALESGGETVHLLGTGQTSMRDQQFFLGELQSVPEGRALQVVDLRSLNLPQDQYAGAAEQSCADIAALAQTLLKSGVSARLSLITRGAVSTTPPDPVSVLQASTWGLASVIANEHPELSCRCIDLAAAWNSSEISDLVLELMSQSSEDRVALRNGQRFVSRLVHRANFQQESATRKPESATRKVIKGESFELHQQVKGALDSFVLRSLERTQPVAEQVEIEIAASGLNFRDILQSLGSLEDGTPGDVALGLEASGTVTRLGKAVEHLAVGDRVMTLSNGLQGQTLFASHVVVDARLVLPVPTSFTMEEAGSFPAAFLTAYISLVNLAHLKKGERVLIHSATGGVGLAAVQIARLLGAEIFATAGSEAKRTYLKELDVEHVMDSRSSGFAESIRAATSGIGVDVILNSLSGDAILEGLQALAPYGRFIELGKRDMSRDSSLGYSALTHNRTLIGFDLATMTRDRPSMVAAALGELISLVDQGQITPLPVQIFPISDAVSAFQHLARSGHIGKIALQMNSGDTRVVSNPQQVKAAATYLVTGGAGALGWEAARELARLGARHIVLTHRSSPSPSILQQIESERTGGIDLQLRSVDVGNEKQLAALLEDMSQTMPPLRGIIHAAGTLDDTVLSNLELERFTKMMSGKSQGALLLDRLTLPCPLDFFVMYSSVTSVLGTPGQGNYAAANAILDALAHDRHRRGLPAITINWGPWSQVGLAAASSNRGVRIADQGLPSLTPNLGIHLLRYVLNKVRDPQVIAMHFESGAWIGAGSPFLSDLPQQQSPQHKPVSGGSLERLLSINPHEALRELEVVVTEQAAAVLGRPGTSIPRTTPFRSVGLDSLMGLELRNRLESKLSLKLPASTIWNHPTIEELARHLGNTLGIGQSDSSENDNQDEAQDQLSLSALLLAEITEAEALLKWD